MLLGWLSDEVLNGGHRSEKENHIGLSENKNQIRDLSSRDLKVESQKMKADRRTSKAERSKNVDPALGGDTMVRWEI